MKRRQFLRGTLVTAGAVIAAPLGCSDETSGSSGSSDTTSGSDAASDDTGGEPTWTIGEQHFPQSLASGDPKPESVVLWTRVHDSDVSGDVPIGLQVATDELFEQLVTLDGQTEMRLTASAAADHCVKVILSGLSPATTYYYRFIHDRGTIRYTTRTGRTRTAPAPEADVPVRFVFASCQDYSGHYFNTWRRVLQLDDVDFVVHLGDYIYETTDNPTFQDQSPDRAVTFADTSGAIAFNPGTDNAYFAARTVSQYRELYKLYRADPDLQAVHERYPMVIIWDDHEFSDDCHGATGTYFAGEQDERDIGRRRAANQAWFEFMPVDYRTENFEYDATVTPPDDITIYRDFRFGKHLHLVMTDLRSYRSDHLIPEDAFPARIVLEQADLDGLLGAVPDTAQPYVDVDTFEGGLYKTVLSGQAAASGYPASEATGLLSVDFINDQVAAWNTARGGRAANPIDSASDGVLRGFAYSHVGKRGHYSSLGSRYLINKDVFDLVAAKRWAETQDSQTMMGSDQQSWFLQTIKESEATWKVWGNEFLMMPLVVDLRSFASLPEAFRQRFYILVDDWTGVTQRRDELIAELSSVDNVVAITGDIHAFFAGNPTHSEDSSKRITELVTAGIASNSLKELLLRTALSDPTLADAGAAALAAGIKGLLKDAATRPTPWLGYAEPTVQGFATVTLDGTSLESEFHHIAESNVTKNLGADLESAFTVERFKVEPGSPDLYRWIDDAWKRWDAATDAWV